MILFKRWYDRLNTHLAGYPDLVISLALWVYALFILIVAIKSPPAAKPALLAYLLLP